MKKIRSRNFKGRIAVVAVLCAMISTKIYGALYVTGSLDFMMYFKKSDLKPWIKIKQDLIGRNGLMWYLTHPVKGYAYILDNGRDCGLFVSAWDSTVVSEVKKSLDRLSASDDTICVEYAYNGQAGSQIRKFDIGRYRNNREFRDSVDKAISHFNLLKAKAFDRRSYLKGYWYLSDTSLYHSSRCMEVFCDYHTKNIIDIDSVSDAYLRECYRRGYEPLIDKGKSYLDGRYTDDSPEVRLLCRYVNMSDSIILSLPLPDNIYDIDFEYDHKKVESVQPMVMGRMLSEPRASVPAPVPIPDSRLEQASAVLGERMVDYVVNTLGISTMQQLPEDVQYILAGSAS